MHVISCAEYGSVSKKGGFHLLIFDHLSCGAEYDLYKLVPSKRSEDPLSQGLSDVQIQDGGNKE